MTRTNLTNQILLHENGIKPKKKKKKQEEIDENEEH